MSNLVVGGILDTEELAALRDVLGDVLGTGAPAVGPHVVGQAEPVALIADDRTIRVAQTEALRRANRWCAAIRPRLLRGVGLKVQVHVDTAETMNAALLRDTVEGNWTRVLEVPGRPGGLVLAVGGPIVEAVAAIVLGADPSAESVARDRPPSETARGVFGSVGDSIVGALAEAWREERNVIVRTIDDARLAETRRHAMGTVESLINVSVLISGATTGQIRLFATPEIYTTSFGFAPTRPAPTTVFGDILAPVPVEVRVELGTSDISMTELANLAVGQVIALNRATDEPLPVTVAGVRKAHGTPVITRGVLGVEIVLPTPRKETP